MSTYLSEEEQVEALKKWWKENGKSVIVGAVLGFAIIFGWQGWQAYQVDQGESASQLFADMQQAVTAGEKDTITGKAQQLMDNYGSSGYAGLAALQLAKLAYENKQKEQARGHLTWVTQNVADDTLKEIARLRLVKLLLDIQAFDAASGLLAQNHGDVLRGEFAHLRGDLAYQQGDIAAAHKAYQESLEMGVADTALLQMKVIDTVAEAK
jgi:predicted negative regulator of RcsB-dependent stress response